MTLCRTPLPHQNRRVAARMLGAHLLAQHLSPCPRAQVGAVIISDLHEARVLCDAWNGPPRKASGEFCSKHGNFCSRDREELAPGVRPEIGCFHAEMNAIYNAARQGVSLLDAWLVTTRAPCIACARAIHHAGLDGVVFAGEPVKDALNYLSNAGVGQLRLGLADADALVRRRGALLGGP